MRTPDEIDDSPTEDPALTAYNQRCEPVTKRSKKPMIVRDRPRKRVNGYSGTRGFAHQQSGR